LTIIGDDLDGVFDEAGSAKPGKDFVR